MTETMNNISSISALMKEKEKEARINSAVEKAWARIAPFWPLRNLAAVNPIAGFEDLPFEQALNDAHIYFQQKEIPVELENINRQTIKWLQVFFDEGQATISMPYREEGFLKSILKLIPFDQSIINNSEDKKKWLKQLPEMPEDIIHYCLVNLNIPTAEYSKFLTLMLTSLPGWAAHILYRTDWADEQDLKNEKTVTKNEYLALRLIVTSLLWPTAFNLLNWHESVIKKVDTTDLYKEISNREEIYRNDLLKSISEKAEYRKPYKPAAQLVFCIDVRSEPFRKSLENQGNYETFGYAGFFGVPVEVKDEISGEKYSSCPVLLKPAHTVMEKPQKYVEQYVRKHKYAEKRKSIYQSIKYNFTTPFSLVETVGAVNGMWMALKSFAPGKYKSVKTKLSDKFNPSFDAMPDIEAIPVDQQVAYALGGLKLIGLTDNFAPLVFFCGHGSKTENNAYSTALDCGACGGRHGAPNARILAEILNKPKVRQKLSEEGINIPDSTCFLAAEHNTTTDEVKIFDSKVPEKFAGQLNEVKMDLEKARRENCLTRATEMKLDLYSPDIVKDIEERSYDWAQVRPEWGLAKNASLIIGPRSLTQNINLAGRSFLHSYDCSQDEDGSSLTGILTAPMVVAQWINAQYFFSTLDNVAFGSGSKVTKNITGKIGVMQGNGSDLMHGLPLQSVFESDTQNYHEPIRLQVIVHAPKSRITSIIEKQDILKKLFGNGWVQLICLEPDDKNLYSLKRDFSWEEATF